MRLLIVKQGEDVQHGHVENLRSEGRQQAEGQEAEGREVTRRSGFALVSFLLGLLVISVTSVLDASLVVALRTTAEEEKNPVGSWLIANYGQYGLFTAKMFGTVGVMLALAFLYKKWTQAAYLVVGVITAFQLSLMYYIFS